MSSDQTVDEHIPLNQKNLAKYSILQVDLPEETDAAKLKKQISHREATRKKTGPKLNLFNKLSLTYINVINYTQRRALYPFAIFFST